MVWCLTLFSTLFNLYCGSHCTFSCFAKFLFSPVLHTIFFPSHWLLSHITIVETMDSGERNVPCRSDYHQSSERILAKPGIEPAISCSQFLYTTNRAMGLGFYLFKDKYGHIENVCKAFFVCNMNESNNLLSWRGINQLLTQIACDSNVKNHT